MTRSDAIMTKTNVTPVVPRRCSISKATLRALLVAATLFAAAVLPAVAQTAPATNPRGGQPGGPPITPKPGGPLAPSASTYKIDAIELTILPGDFVEYKFDLKTGAMMVFNWKATGPVDVDFHTVPAGKPISASETFMRGTASKGQGTYRAPYAGLHGWYWLNTGKTMVTITLIAAGFFTEARMFSGDPVGEPMEVRDPDPPPVL
jgi:hypothetical protein